MAPKLSCVILGGVILLGATSASAGGLLAQEIGAPRNGTAQAGQAAYAYDAATSFYNPAGMARLEKSQWLVGLQPIITDIQFDLKSTTTVAWPATTRDSEATSSPSPSPSSLG